MVLQINLSNIIKNAGNTIITVTIEISAPLDINVHKEPIISIFEYAPTPNVAPKKHNPLTTIEEIDVDNASFIASCFVLLSFLNVTYLVVIKIE